MGTKNNPSEFDCYENAGDDEPMFILLARDPLAPNLVRRWANRRERAGNANPDKMAEARQCAKFMEIWYRENRDASTA